MKMNLCTLLAEILKHCTAAKFGTRIDNRSTSNKNKHIIKMKRIHNLLIALMLLVFAGGNVIAQNAKTSEVDIKVSSQCSMCKETIERALAFEKGVVKSNVDLETNTVKVTYKNGKTDADQIRKAISLAGYDADDVPADQKSYAKLSDCCKKPDDRINKEAEHNH